jgi:hypothetical protein
MKGTHDIGRSATFSRSLFSIITYFKNLSGFKFLLFVAFDAWSFRARFPTGISRNALPAYVNTSKILFPKTRAIAGTPPPALFDFLSKQLRWIPQINRKILFLTDHLNHGHRIEVSKTDALLTAESEQPQGYRSTASLGEDIIWPDSRCRKLISPWRFHLEPRPPKGKWPEHKVLEWHTFDHRDAVLFNRSEYIPLVMNWAAWEHCGGSLDRIVV